MRSAVLRRVSISGVRGEGDIVVGNLNGGEMRGNCGGRMLLCDSSRGGVERTASKLRVSRMLDCC